MSRRRLLAGLLVVASGLACGIEELGEPEPRAPATPPPGSPVALHGRLHVEGLQLTDEHGEAVRLRGVSDQGIQWFPFGTCITDASLDFLAAPEGMAIDVLRVPVYVEEGGYLDDPRGMAAAALEMIDHAIARGLYVIVDWHVTSFDPNDRLDEAKEFFRYFGATYAGHPNVLYEIANEPSGVGWSRIAAYADALIPSLRMHDPLAPIVVGTPDDSGELADVADAPLTGANAANVLYTFHFYAASMELGQIVPYLDRIPIFVTEWGAASYDGDSPDDYEKSALFVAALDGPAQRVSFVGWSFTDDRESSAMLLPGTCATEEDAGGPWTMESLSVSGQFMRAQLVSP
ncbi:glycoside hydrolase family 5 protein [Nannocystis sp. ILAH1]|uniref:glycoside hydrolase family 5 protein n=1 Tax=Nannocystis sp. ILAH1 TaxID=2996789 RepID=UPI00226E50C8|nr:glycoside hydrolase family 5 protein [Nannocystis sp. ILAH1]MCY0989104.1 glycoside hydrolase family 5 protein [Nannocystis sp. ILAH1]